MDYIYTKDPGCRPARTIPIDGTITFRIYKLIKMLLRDFCEANRMSMSKCIILALESWDPLNQFMLQKAQEITALTSEELQEKGIFQRALDGDLNL